MKAVISYERNLLFERLSLLILLKSENGKNYIASLIRIPFFVKNEKNILSIIIKIN